MVGRESGVGRWSARSVHSPDHADHADLGGGRCLRRRPCHPAGEAVGPQGETRQGGGSPAFPESSPRVVPRRQTVGLAAAGLTTAGLACPLAGALFGMTRAVILRPSIVGGRSTFPASASFSRTASSTRRPSSWCCISRPRNRTVTCTLSLCSRNLRAWETLVSTSWSPVFGRTRISFSFCWRTLPALLPFCELAKRILP